MDEPVPGYPKRSVPRDEDAAKALKKRTLTNLYNARPQWLADAHGSVFGSEIWLIPEPVRIQSLGPRI